MKKKDKKKKRKEEEIKKEEICKYKKKKSQVRSPNFVRKVRNSWTCYFSGLNQVVQ